MISLQTSKQILSEESLPKKRKLEDSAGDISEKPADRTQSTKAVSDRSVQRETQFPLEWQRCLDIKSGQLYFYNTRTNKRALGDPRSSLAASNSPPMSLELELNPPSQSLGKDQSEDSCRKHDSGTISIYPNDQYFMNSNTTNDAKGLARSPSWLTFEGEQQEMVTAVCKKCYMLVMMCKSSPSCPNCKFVHPSDQPVRTSSTNS